SAVVFAAGVQHPRAGEFLERRFNNMLELVIVPAPPDLIVVKFGDLIPRYVVLGQFRFGKYAEALQEIHLDCSSRSRFIRRCARRLRRGWVNKTLCRHKTPPLVFKAIAALKSLLA